MHTFFNSNIYDFSGNFQGILDGETYITTIPNMQNIGWKSQFLKSVDVSMLSHGCGVSKYTHFYDIIKKKIYIMLPRLYVGRYSGENSHQFFRNHGFLH